jgi:hypothetical protein
MGSEEESLLQELGARSSLLDNDTIPNANQSMACFSCDEPMTGLYCYACGNKNDNYRRSVWSLCVELFQSMTAFEGRIWRSLYSLVVHPGQMARDYADGARQKWTSPIRMFLATSLLLFGYIALSGTQMIALGDLKDGDQSGSSAINIEEGQETYKQSLLFFVRQSDLKPPPDRLADVQLSSMLEDMRSGWNNYEGEEDFEQAMEELQAIIDSADNEQVRNSLVKTRDAILARKSPNNEGTTGDTDEPIMTDEEIQAVLSEATVNDSTMQIGGLNGQQVNLDSDGMARLYDRILRNPQIINNELNQKLKWAMFFMMPFAMFMGALFIRGRDTAMLYDHLVHAAYVHSFSFLLLFLFILLGQFTTIPYLIGLYTVILLIYLPVSAKGAFKRGWFKSFLTAYGVGSLYTLTIFIIAVVIVVGALQNAALEFGEARTINRQTISITPASTPPETETDPA